MEISEIKFRKFLTEGRLRGIVSVTFDGVFAVHDIKVIQGDKRLFVAMPSRRDESGIFRDIVHPITLSARSRIESEILDAYERESALHSAEDGE
ncbi:MAG: septation regulator SpoVG [Ruminococcus sp.]|nr:septation regulator SpoVG [Ruminococcus sp.]